MAIETDLDLWSAAPSSFTAYRTAVLAYRLWRGSPDGQANRAGYPIGVLDQWAALAYAPQRETAPKAAWIQWRAEQRRILVGLYAWPYDFKTYRDEIRAAEVTTMRLAHDGMTDDRAAALAEDGYPAHVTYSGSSRQNFRSDGEFVAAYCAGLASFLDRFGHAFDAVEVWNEPNFGMWTNATNTAKQKLYGPLLTAAHDVVKAHDPALLVVGFGAGGVQAAAPGFIRGVLAQTPAAADAFDVVSWHPYIGDSAPEDTRREAWGSWSLRGCVESIRQVTDRPQWWTEAGWQITQAAGGRFNPDPRVCVTPDQQADYRRRLAVLAGELEIGRLHHMYVYDVDGYNGGFWRSHVARPAVAALKAR